MDKPKVFISSTYKDLKEYREKVWRVLSELEIEILGMEKFGARPSKPLDTCLEEVSQAKVFIGIIGFKYGSIDKETKKSYTQLEYETARECNQEILIYFFDENSLIHPKNIDSGTLLNKLDNFKKELKKNHTFDTFLNPDDLSHKIYSKLQDIIPKLPKVYIRPPKLKTKLHRFFVGKEKWIAFVGYLGTRPVELYSGCADNEIFPIPDSINSGYIVEWTINEKKGKAGYRVYVLAFQYIDKYGYTNTLSGLGHVFNSQISVYNDIISELLKKETPLNTIISTLELMHSTSIGKKLIDWKNGIKEALTVNH